MLLVVVALLCIPWMLLAKPILIMRNQRKMHIPVSCDMNETRWLISNSGINIINKLELKIY